MRPAVARTSATPPQACIQRLSCWARARVLIRLWTAVSPSEPSVAPRSDLNQAKLWYLYAR